jgi:curved DNA-binding protein CbpA
MNPPQPPEQPNNPKPQADLTSSDPYSVLGLARGASLGEIKRAYFALVREYPPETEAEAFKLVRAAYEKLRTADVKAETDLFLFQPPPPWSPRKRRKKIDLTLDPADIFFHLYQLGDLGRASFKEDYRPIRL